MRLAPLLGLLLAAAAGDANASLKRVDKAVAELSEQLLAGLDARGATVAVLPFENAEGKPTELGRLFADGLTEAVLRTGRLAAVDRNYVSRMMNEISLGVLGLAEAKTAAEVGKFSGARYLLVGRAEPSGRKGLRVSARLVETESSRLAASAKTDLKLDGDLRQLYQTPARLDPAAHGLFAAEETGQAVFLGQTGPNDCRWIEARASAAVERDPAAARAAAIALARARASGLLTGHTPPENPEFDQPAYQGQIEAVLRATRSGRVEEEKLVEDKLSGKRATVTLHACMRPLSAAAAGGLSVELMLNQNRFFAGQDARAILTASRDAYLYLFSVDFGGKAGRVFPVEGAGGNRLTAGKPFIFPNEDHRAAGVRMVAELPEGRKDSIEMLRALACEREVGRRLESARSYAELVRALDESGAAWAEDVRVFTIYSR